MGKSYNVGDHESSANLSLTPEGGFIFSGITENESGDKNEVVIIKTDGEGHELTSKILYSNFAPEAWGLIWQNGSYIYYGGTTLSTGTEYYLTLMKFNM